MKILAISVKTKVVLTISGTGPFELERKKQGEDWKVLYADGFIPRIEVPEGEDTDSTVTPPDGTQNIPTQDDVQDNPTQEDTEDTPPQDTTPMPIEVMAGDIVDSDVTSGLYQYRISKYTQNQNTETDTDTEKQYQYTSWVVCGETGPVGYTFFNYEPAEGEWGDPVTPDDIRFTYMWGTDLKAANGQSMTDEQIRYFVMSSMEALGRELNITIIRKRVKTNAKARGLKKKEDYDVNEDLYRFSYDKIARYGLITTRLRPIIKLDSIKAVGRVGIDRDLTDSVVVDHQKGSLRLLKRPIKPTMTSRGISQAIGIYGTETFTPYLFYEIDYEAGYETAADVPADLREVVGKHAAVSMLNVVGDGLMSGFSSSSLSMDGMSESFSSTQSATSAYFGARIKEYKDDIANYIKQNKQKFSNLAMGCL